MSMSQLTRDTFLQQNSVTVRDRLAINGVLVQQADFTAISYAVADHNNNDSNTGGGSLIVGSVIFDTLQLDDDWDI